MREGGDIPPVPDEEPDREARRPARPPSGWATEYAGKQFSGLFAQMLPSLTKSIFAGLAPDNTATLFPYIKTADLLLPQLKLLPVSLVDSTVQQMGKNIVGVIEKQGGLSKTLFEEVQANCGAERGCEGLKRPPVIGEENPPRS